MICHKCGLELEGKNGLGMDRSHHFACPDCDSLSCIKDELDKRWQKGYEHAMAGKIYIEGEGKAKASTWRLGYKMGAKKRLSH